MIDVYRDFIRFFGDKDPTTRVMVEEILADEEEHANDLTDLLFIANPTTGKTEGKTPAPRSTVGLVRVARIEFGLTHCRPRTTKSSRSRGNRTGASTRNDGTHHEPTWPQRSRHRR